MNKADIKRIVVKRMAFPFFTLLYNTNNVTTYVQSNLPRSKFDRQTRNTAHRRQVADKYRDLKICLRRNTINTRLTDYPIILLNFFHPGSLWTVFCCCGNFCQKIYMKA